MQFNNQSSPEMMDQGEDQGEYGAERYEAEEMQESPDMDYGEEDEEEREHAMEDDQGESFHKQNTHPYPKPYTQQPYSHEDDSGLE
jgi:hypothetical protein